MLLQQQLGGIMGSIPPSCRSPMRMWLQWNGDGNSKPSIMCLYWSQLRAHGGDTALSRYTTMIHCFGSDFASCLSVNHGLVPCFGRSLLHDPSAGTSTISPVLCPWSKQINRASLPCLGTPAHGVYALGVPYCTPLKLPLCTPWSANLEC